MARNCCQMLWTSGRTSVLLKNGTVIPFPCVPRCFSPGRSGITDGAFVCIIQCSAECHAAAWSAALRFLLLNVRLPHWLGILKPLYMQIEFQKGPRGVLRGFGCFKKFSVGFKNDLRNSRWFRGVSRTMLTWELWGLLDGFEGAFMKLFVTRLKPKTTLNPLLKSLKTPLKHSETSFNISWKPIESLLAFLENILSLVEFRF